MDFSLCSSLYWEFRNKIIGNFASAKDFLQFTAQNFQPLAKELHVAYYSCGLLPPPSQQGPVGEYGKEVIYHDTASLPILPPTTEIADTYSTGEQGTCTIDIHPVAGHHFTDEEKNILQVITWDIYVHLSQGTTSQMKKKTSCRSLPGTSTSMPPRQDSPESL